jgi:pantetheine-phosphate adenylyltransferase
MTRIAIYPGSFDPPTRGHEDLVRRSAALADTIIVAVATNSAKSPLFSVEERLDLLRQVVGDVPGTSFESFDGLLVDFARSRGATILVRGLRAVSDFEYEFQMALMNRELYPDLETVFLAPEASRSFLSASLIREISTLGGDVSPFVSAPVLERLRAKTAADPEG